MKILLTGASGFLGQHVLRQLLRQGHDVVALGRSQPVEGRNCTWRSVDLLSCPDLERTLCKDRPTHLLHLAWYTEHGAYWHSPCNLRWVDASLRLLQAFAAQGGQYALMAGSCAEYDWSHGYLREASTPLEPASLYGSAKDATRRLAQAWCRTIGLPFAWAHIFYPFGAGEAKGRMLPSLIEVFQGRAAPFGVNARAYRDLLPVQDAARALEHLLVQGHQGRFNVCSGQPIVIEDVVRRLARLCGTDPSPVLRLASARPGEPHLLVGENQLLLSSGWSPQYSLEQGLALQLALMK